VSAKRKQTVAVIFGGRSVEHDVSVVTGHQIIKAFDPQAYDVIPVYITRDGKWFTGEPLLDLENFRNEVISHKGVEQVILSPTIQHHGLIINPISGRLQKSDLRRIDVVFPAIHGSHGEDGTLQGLCEMADVPYVGCAVLASAVANDKAITKSVLANNNIPVVDGLLIHRDQWQNDREATLATITEKLTLPVFVKPATLGSSIGVTRADTPDALAISLDIATNFDRRVVVEKAIIGGVEINCAVMGYADDMSASVLEQPVSWETFLTYEEKYMRGGGGMKGAERLIPAPLTDTLTAKIQQTAINAFRAIDGRGIARIDFLVYPDTETVFLNEINTMPGSLAFYLWRESGLSAQQVVDKLVNLAQDAYADKRKNTYNYETSLIELTASRGLKGVKGAKTMVTSSN
jgi:D-alanine-D-alanine ligase